jgi:hypothetical protein
MQGLSALCLGEFGDVVSDTAVPGEDADASLTPGAPFLPILEPALLLFSLALGILGGPIRDVHSRDALRLLMGWRINLCVRAKESS